MIGNCENKKDVRHKRNYIIITDRDTIARRAVEIIKEDELIYLLT